MKSNNQTIITAIAIAIVGALILTLIPTLPSSISFALGAIAVGAALYFMQTPKEATPIDNTETSQSSKTLYVGNLPYRANETDVKNLFAEHGDVFAVRLMKDKRTGKRRGFGFVVMSSLDADSAIEQLNNKEYGQRTLKVREANEPKNADTDISETE
ncbi:RNA-binding protein [Photobacterium angustum]|uniref:RNA recognition motif domain-containing protein n=1 Tax=Photobacterium angustum TaxID=661 RepID=UPI0005E3F223|nr:RNA-binding protein [Photobacterium angustum]KJF93150.1 RNA-binding protein [Photobacterium angustum]KJG00815.1 RNA-binding protein [Photobacterium angustum]KJG04944.1 RNA-binding protein [Photobacterium angustum]PSV65702.1 RNA-binding protein [Photobacterium angustum]PSV89259.1 RNA-binding protein [Photobacterium angustum]